MKLNDPPYYKHESAEERRMRENIRPGQMQCSHGFVFIWRKGEPKTISPNEKRSASEGMPVVICAWDNNLDANAHEIFAISHQSLN